MMVKLNDVVDKISGNEDRFNTDLEYYLAGEHYESERIAIYKKGIIKDDLNTLGFKFHFPFKRGDTIFMSRNPHLKKAGMATYDGICSDTSYILRTKNEDVLLGRFLPLILQNNRFWKWFEENKSGSVNYLLNWKTLKEYEFDLPTVKEQKRIADLVWSMEETLVAYEKLLLSTDELVKSQFIEMFGSPVSMDKNWPIKTLSDVATSQLGKMLNAKKQTGANNRYYLANRNIQWFNLDLSDLRMMDFDEKDRKKYELQDGDLLVCEGGEIGRCAVWHGEITDCYIQNAVHRVRCNTKLIHPVFLAHILYYHAQENGFLDIIGSRSTIAHFPADKLKAMKIYLPPITLQMQFVQVTQQADKSKFEIEQAISELKVLTKSVINQIPS